MNMRWGRPLTVLLVVVALLAACTGAPPSFHRTQARSGISEIVRVIGVERHDDIDGFARSAVELIDTFRGDSVTLVGIYAEKQKSADDPFGMLVFRVQLAATQIGKNRVEAFDACYEAEFNAFGATNSWVFNGDIEITEAICPDNPIPVTPLVDDSTVFVVAPNAEESATLVLSELKGKPPSDAKEVAQRIEALLERPTGKFDELAHPTVVVDDGDVGVAMGTTPDDCVLVALVDGQVSRIRPAPIRLERGELGCRPETAIADPAQLGYPH